jgi:hypothetical protein
MTYARYGAAAAQLQDGKLLVTGGWDENWDTLNTSEILTEDGWESNIPLLPVTISYHCMVTINSTTVMVIGGIQNGQTTGDIFYFTFGTDTWTPGPALNNKRTRHKCGKIRRNKESHEMSIIAAGGFYSESQLSSVEILDEGSNEWKTGPELPSEIEQSQMVEDQNEGVILIGGYSSSHGLLDTLYQLPHGGQGADWTPMVQKLQIARYRHTAFLVPDSAVNCSSI